MRSSTTSPIDKMRRFNIDDTQSPISFSYKKNLNRNLVIKNSMPTISDSYSNVNTSGRTFKYNQGSQTNQSKLRMNPRSQKIVENMKKDGRYSPLCTRSIKEEQIKQAKLVSIRDLRNIENEQVFATYTHIPQVHDSKSGERSVQDFLTDMSTWQQNKNDKILSIKKANNLSKDVPSFKPTLDQNSYKIMSLDTKESHEYRLFQKQSCQDKQQEFSFQPKINPNSQVLALKNRSDIPVDERLYRNIKAKPHLSRQSTNLYQFSDIMEQSRIRNEYKQMWQRLSELQQQSIDQDDDELEFSEFDQKENQLTYLEVKDYSATYKLVQKKEHQINMENYKFIYQKLNLYSDNDEFS